MLDVLSFSTSSSFSAAKKLKKVKASTTRYNIARKTSAVLGNKTLTPIINIIITHSLTLCVSLPSLPAAVWGVVSLPAAVWGVVYSDGQ